jgi:hypothetical protein
MLLPPSNRTRRGRTDPVHNCLGLLLAILLAWVFVILMVVLVIRDLGRL